MVSTGSAQRLAVELARDLVEQCDTLAQSLAELDSAPADEVEGAVWGHLSAVRPVCSRITALARELSRRRDEILRLPPEDREQLTLDVAGCRCAVEKAGRMYGELGGAVKGILAAIDRELRSIRRGGRMLGSYRRGAELVR